MTTRTRAQPPAPCRHRADEPLTAGEAAARGLAPVRKWFACNHPRRIELTVAEFNCPCKTCNRQCAGYEPADQPKE